MENVASMEENRRCVRTKLWSENLKEIDCLGDQRVNMVFKEHNVRRWLKSVSFSRMTAPCCYFRTSVKFVMHDVLCAFRKIKSVPAVAIIPKACFSGEISVKTWYDRVTRIQQAPAREGLLVKDRLLC